MIELARHQVIAAGVLAVSLLLGLGAALDFLGDMLQ